MIVMVIVVLHFGLGSVHKKWENVVNFGAGVNFIVERLLVIWRGREVNV